jgi:hypothetical protein
MDTGTDLCYQGGTEQAGEAALPQRSPEGFFDLI